MNKFRGILAIFLILIFIGGAMAIDVPSDIDGDSIPDESDNCPFVSNVS